MISHIYTYYVICKKFVFPTLVSHFSLFRWFAMAVLGQIDFVSSFWTWKKSISSLTIWAVQHYQWCDNTTFSSETDKMSRWNRKRIRCAYEAFASSFLLDVWLYKFSTTFDPIAEEIKSCSLEQRERMTKKEVIALSCIGLNWCDYFAVFGFFMRYMQK